MPALTFRMAGHAADADLAEIADLMLGLMLPNLATEGYRFVDPQLGLTAEPGCFIASPSDSSDWPEVTDQHYVKSWVRDSAITALELALVGAPMQQRLREYVSFGRTCQQQGDLGYACYEVDGTKRRPGDWPAPQNDGPALRVLAILAAWGELDGEARTAARQIVQDDATYVLDEYQLDSVSPWEEERGGSFFVRSVQLRCLRELQATVLDVPKPPSQALADAISWLENALAGHWDGANGHYISVIGDNVRAGYDPNSDVVLACIYGAARCDDPRLLATAAQIRDTWTQGKHAYDINGRDLPARGPLHGRYPSDPYDGDAGKGGGGTTGHPWALCTSAFAELYYRVASVVAQDAALLADPVCQRFFEQAQASSAEPADAPARLRDAGDRMLRALVYHSDFLQLSEQFDAATGIEKSVRNLTWSYCSFRSAVRASLTA